MSPSKPDTPKSFDGIYVFDDFLDDPEAYRQAALTREYQTFNFPEATFHGISPTLNSPWLDKLQAMFPGIETTLTFFRQSPAGQLEPHLIHTDVDMGEWTAILYLNPLPPPSDGTSFWTHVSGAHGSMIPHERSEEGKSFANWRLRWKIRAKFNRVVLFPSHYFHSRAIYDNWGRGDWARLTQVAFGRGNIKCL